jgi:hypothetical protein
MSLARPVRPRCSTGRGITLVWRAIQGQFVMRVPAIHVQHDGQMILRGFRLDPGLHPDLVFLVGAAGIEPATPRL